MMDLIRVQRSFDALQKVLTTSGDMDKAAQMLPR
jgi:flagellar basal body rod protein FlgG